MIPAWTPLRHSPDPWALRYGINRLAHCVVAEIGWQTYVVTEDAEHAVTRDETTANGHLIRAAPVLFRAVLRAEDLLRNFDLPTNARTRSLLREAIAAAAPPWTT